MKKLNHIWVISDGIKGHEIQSLAVAQQIAQHVSIYRCRLKQPWLTFAPRIMPFFSKGLVWNDSIPDSHQTADAIISCGRRMAAVAKHLNRTLTQKLHIQILNPGDNHNNYDLIICPQHDELTGSNVIITIGSIHSFDAKRLQKNRNACLKKLNVSQPLISVFLGNPKGDFFDHLQSLSQTIKNNYPNHQLAICASRRTGKQHYRNIKKHFKAAHICWLSKQDGENPYQCLLAASDIFIVTADSINMVSEACATDKPVIAVAQQQLLAKHHRFLRTIQYRLSGFSQHKNFNQPLETINEVTHAVLGKLSSKKQ